MAQAVFFITTSTTIHRKSCPLSLFANSLTISYQTRITTKYKILSPPKLRKEGAPNGDAAPATAPQYTTRATLTLKTYDPASGVCLKYRTDKGAEVGRLIATLGRLGRHMAALPETAEPIEDGAADTAQDGTTTAEQTETNAPATKAIAAAKDAGMASKKKRKGKK